MWPLGARGVCVALHRVRFPSTSPSPHLGEAAQTRKGQSGRVYNFSRAVSGRRSSDSHFLSPGAGGLHPARAAAVPAGLADPCTGAHEPPAPGPTLRTGSSGSMGGARDAGWVAAGLVLGAGACYCIYRLMRGQRRGGHGLRLRPSQSAGEAAGCPAGEGGTGVGVGDAAGARGLPVL